MLSRDFLIYRAMGAFLCLLLAGCGRSGPLKYEPAAVSGKVSYKNEPLEKGLIRFIPDTEVIGGQVAGKPVFANIQAGEYNIPVERGAAVGKNRIEIVSYHKTGKTVQMEDTVVDEEVQFLPERFNTKSTLSADVQPGENQLDFSLQ